MKHNFGKIIIIVLGGSIIFPDEIDWKFLKNFKLFIEKWIRHKQFIIVVGGGQLSRIYQKTVSKIVLATDKDKDWLGIYATRSNAHLLRIIFQEVADPKIIDSRHKINKLNYPITIASGWRPGWSTDYIGIALAKDFVASTAIMAGKPSYVYNKDNQIHKDAKPLISLDWDAYQKLIPKEWSPGIHAPVDPVAADLAKKNEIEAIVINGKNINNFDNLLGEREFEGSIIK